MKTRLIINPISGGKRKPLSAWQVPAERFLPSSEIYFTQHAGHATELAADAVAQGYERIWVAGGDGTINEVARALVGTSTALGIIPKGSGNGLARELGMPLSYEKALAALQTARPVACDVGIANGAYFFNVAGVGIEAEIARQFDTYGKQGKRGKWPYFKLGANAVFSYQPLTLQLQTDEHKNIQTLSPLTLVFANGTQYGSGFYIAPQARLTDGTFEMVEVKNVSKWRLLLAAAAFFRKAPLPRSVVNTQAVRRAVITSDRDIIYHMDGEPQPACRRLTIELLPGALQLLIPAGR